jgi:phenylacetate-CoA ligase
MAEVFPRRLAIINNQADRLRALLAAIIPANPFYTQKFEASGAAKRFPSLERFFSGVPFTSKQELVEDQRVHSPYGSNLTYPLEHYSRCHQTSGTAGTPLRWLDTPESWSAMLANWEQILRVAGVTRGDRAFFAFSFGPFIGFWLGFEAAVKTGCLCLPGGGLSSVARLRAILDLGATVVCGTPTYALHLAQVAATEGIDLGASQVRRLIVAGEPGGSLPATRQQLESLWPGARVFDHHGMTEVGPVTYECPARPGVLHVLEGSFIPEVIDPTTGAAVASGERGELVLTTLVRTGSPLLRYRTGDLVKTAVPTMCECGRSELALEGGILGRTDDMVVIRGVNVYPAAVDEVVRACGGVAEYQVEVTTAGSLAELSLQFEPAPDCADVPGLVKKLRASFEAAFSLRVPVRAVAAGTLPRFELKAKRWKLS